MLAKEVSSSMVSSASETVRSGMEAHYRFGLKGWQGTARERPAMANSPDCLSPEAVARLVKGGAGAAESERIHIHLEVCGDCQRRVAEAVGADPEARWP